MTGLANPGGQSRRLMRTALAQWLTAQRIQGLDHVYRSVPPTTALELYRTGVSTYSCQAWIKLPTDKEERLVKTGPVLPTGKIVHYDVELEIWHRSYEPSEQDWADDEDDYDRIYEALKDCLRADGRTAGRPDVIVQIGEFGGISGHHSEPETVEGGAVDRSGVLAFTVTQVI